MLETVALRRRYIALHVVTCPKHAAYTAPLKCSCPLAKQIDGGIDQLNRRRTMKNSLMKTTLGMLMLGSLGLAATGAQADGDRNGHGYRQNEHAYWQSLAFNRQIDARQARQMERIRAGLRDGSLTRHEFRNLIHEQHEICVMERHFRADGIIDAHEFRRLDHALDQASRDIGAERHDRQARYAYYTGRRFN